MNEIKLHPITFRLILATLYKLKTFGSEIRDSYTDRMIWDKDDDAVLAILEDMKRRHENDKCS